MISYEQCNQLKKAGFPQKRKNYSRYYVTPDIIAFFEDIKNSYGTEYLLDGNETPINWTEKLTYIPELIDFMGIDNYKKSLEVYSQEWIKNNSDVIIHEDNKTKEETF